MKFPNRIREHRDAKGWSIERLADEVSLSVGYISRLERGERNLSQKHMEELGRALGVTPGDFLPQIGARPSSVVQVRGIIGAGGVIETSAEQLGEGEGLYDVEVPFALPLDAIAFEVRGLSMWPRYDDGDVIVCHRLTVDPEPLIGWEAAVGTPDGNRYLKRLLKGSKKGHYRLESHNAPAMDDVKLAWFSDITLVVRANQVRRLSKGAKRKLEKALRI